MAAESGAKRYATAAFEVARDDGRLGEWAAGIEDLVTLFSDDGALAYFESGKVPEEQKFDLVERALKGAEPKLINLAKLLVRKGRTALAPGIARELRKLIDEQQGMVRARVTTAVELSPDGRRSVQARLEELTGKQVTIETEVDEAIIGGLVARLGDRVIDGSTRTRLVELRKRLEGQPR
ncbi:MAG: ATP synthase F1 subunit delta [Dehalococcoidia bacterium]